MVEFSSAIIYAVIAAIVGIIIGEVDARFTANLSKPKKDENAEEEAKAKIIDDHAALVVLIDPAQNIKVKMDGIPVTHENITPEQRRRMVNLIVQIRPLLDGGPIAQEKPAPPTLRSLSPVPIEPTPAKEIKSPNIFSAALDYVNSAVKTPEKKNLSIVEMIDEVLQEKIAVSPYAKTGVSMSQSPEGGVLVTIGLAKYQGIDAVPDPAIQALIREATAEWEKRDARK